MGIKTTIDEQGLHSERADQSSLVVNLPVTVNSSVSLLTVQTVQMTTSSDAGTVVLLTLPMPASSTLDVAADVHAYSDHMGNSLVARNYMSFYRNGATAVANMGTEDDTSTKSAGVGSGWTTALTSSGADVILTLTTTQASTRVSATAEYKLVKWA